MSHANAHFAAPSVRAGRGAVALDLLDNLAALQDLLKALVELADRKLQSMRAADSAGLHACAIAEHARLEELFALDQRRTAILAALAQTLRMPDAPGRRLSEIAKHLPEPAASALRARSHAIREISQKLQQRNRVAAQVAQSLQAHIRGVFAELARSAGDSVVYGRGGRHESCTERMLIDAVG